MTYFKNDPRLLALADGTVITSANNAAPDALTKAGTAGGVVTFRDLAGVKSYEVTAPAAEVARLDKTIASPRAAAEVMLDFTAATAPTGADTRVLVIFNSGTGGGAGVGVTTAGNLRLYDFAGGVLWTSPAVVIGKRVRVYHGMEIGTGTADGEIHLDCFFDTDADGTTPTSGWTYHSAVVNAGTVNFTAIRFGKVTSSPAFSGMRIGYLHGNDAQYTAAGLGPIAAPVTNVAPTANAGPDQTAVEPWSTVTLTATASDPDGTTPTVSWTQTAGSPVVTLGGSGAVRTFEAPATIAGTTLTFTATASDGSLTGTDSMTVTVLPVTERAVIGGVEVPMRIRAN